MYNPNHINGDILLAPKQSHRGESNRPRRVAEVLKRGLADVLRQDYEHPDAAKITLTAVDMSPDLRNARVFFTLLTKEIDSNKITADLNKASGYFRHCLRDRVDLRGLPKLKFEYDTSVDRGAHMEALFDQLHKNDRSGSD